MMPGSCASRVARVNRDTVGRLGPSGPPAGPRRSNADGDSAPGNRPELVLDAGARPAHAGAAAQGRERRRDRGNPRLQPEKRRKAIRAMMKWVAQGMPAGKAMGRAHDAGATWKQIGDYFDCSQQAAYERAKAWRERARS